MVTVMVTRLRVKVDDDDVDVDDVDATADDFAIDLPLSSRNLIVISLILCS